MNDDDEDNNNNSSSKNGINDGYTTLVYWRVVLHINTSFQYFKKVYVNSDQSIILPAYMSCLQLLSLSLHFSPPLFVFVYLIHFFVLIFTQPRYISKNVLNGSQLSFVITIFLYFLFLDSFVCLSFALCFCLCFKTLDLCVLLR